MVDEKPRRPAPLPRRRKPGKPADIENARSDRLIMRAHPDLVEILEKRAKERKMSRSGLVETILVGYLTADPRNPKMENNGRIDLDAPSPLMLRDRDIHKFAARWKRFVDMFSAMNGHPPPEDWFDDEDRYWFHLMDQPESPPTEEEEAEDSNRRNDEPDRSDEPMPLPARWATKRAAEVSKKPPRKR